MAPAFVIIFVAGMLGGTFAGGPYFNNQACLESAGWYGFNGDCYMLFTDGGFGGLSQPDTVLGCKNLGPKRIVDGDVTFLAGLATIHSQEENDFVSQNITGGQRAWIGCIRNRVRDVFVWMDDPTGDMTYTNWKNGEPNNQNEEEACVEINRGPVGEGKWNDIPCRRKISGVCKYTLADVPPN